jgi:hypothetical protein
VSGFLSVPLVGGFRKKFLTEEVGLQYKAKFHGRTDLFFEN